MYSASMSEVGKPKFGEIVVCENNLYRLCSEPQLTWIEVNIVFSRRSIPSIRQSPVADVTLLVARVVHEELAQCVAVNREGYHATVHGTVFHRHRIGSVMISVGHP